MNIETNRTYLRFWRLDEAKEFYEIAKYEEVVAMRGWTAHKNLGESKKFIEKYFLNNKNYAICLKESDMVIGGFEVVTDSDVLKNENEIELRYWLSKEFWGKGIMPEVVKEMIKYLFEMEKIEKIYADIFEGNTKSKRVLEKCGFKYEYTIENKRIVKLDRTVTMHISSITVDDWKKDFC